MQNPIPTKNPFYKLWIFWAVIVYILIIFLYSIGFILSEGKNKLLTSNELGDFLSGVFAPLAFLFLYLGYKQQGEEMKQNTAALKLQAEELKNSVDEQKRLIQIHEQEQYAKQFAARPYITCTFSHSSIREFEDDILDDDGCPIEWVLRKECEIAITIVNEGELAKEFCISDEENSVIFACYEFKKNQKEINPFYIFDSDVDQLIADKYFAQIFTLDYFDQHGNKFQKKIKLEIKYYAPDNEYYSVLKIID